MSISSSSSSSSRVATSGRPARIIIVVAGPVLAAICSCGQAPRGGAAVDEQETDVSAVTATCSSSNVKVVDLHADFRDIWKGTETPDTGKQADPTLKVGIDFDTTVQPSSVKAQFIPVTAGGSCGATVQATLSASVVAPTIWGTATTDAARAPVPAPFNVLVRDGITGIVSAAGPIAAGGDVSLSSMSINGTAHQPVGLIVGGRATLSNGSISGDLTYGIASVIPGTVTVTGTKSLKPFDPKAAFKNLASLSTLLSEETPNATVTASNGSLQLTGTKSTLNVFQVSSDALAQASSVQITVPAGAGALVNVTGNATVALQNKGLTLQGATAAKLVWNIPRAAFVQISSISLQGSVLAPRALVTFDSGNINGTLVGAAFASSGSGSLQFTPLNVSQLFPAATPSFVELTPAQPLARGCSYQFVIPGDVPLTSTNGCLSPPLSVTFRVAGSAGTASGRELLNVEADPTSHTLRRFTARQGVNTPVDDALARYESAIGIAVANLVPVSGSVPSSTRAGQTITVYQQYAQGYPVAGYGYFVATAGSAFRAANGKVMPGLPTFPAPTVTSATALQKVLTYLNISQAPWVVKPNLYQAPVGRLVLAPKRLFPTGADFALVWDVRLGPGAGISEPNGVQIDAATGAVVRADRGQMGLTTLAAGATYDGQTVAATVDTIYDGNGRSFQAASYHNPGQSAAVATLATADVTANGVLKTVTGATLDAFRNVNTSGIQHVVNPTPATPWNNIGPLEQRMAGQQFALEVSDAFMQSLGLRIKGSPWQTIDGLTPARQKVIVNYTDGVPPPNLDVAEYLSASTADTAYIFFYRAPPLIPLQANILAHEYTHALVDSIRRSANLGRMVVENEAGSVNEGVADLFAIAMNHSRLNPNGDWFCVSFDQGKGAECYRNIRDPLSSTINLYLGVDPNAIAGLPPLYKDVLLQYRDYSATPLGACTKNDDMCGAHQNSTIVSHWGYLVAMGSGPLAVPCSIKIDPLDPDPDTSLRMALNIALRAIGTRTGLANATFADFRDATLQVAEEMVDEGTLAITALPKIELAWAAVGLPPSTFHSDVASPANVSGAYPWAKFAWPISGDGQSASSWDFQITTTTFDNPAYHQEGITRLGDDSQTNVLPLSLPYSVPDTFYWRVRPHSPSNLPWEICYPIHSFVGTTVPDPVTNLAVVADLNTSGDVLPGPFDVSWDAVRGTDVPDYNFFIGTQNPGCPAGNDPSKLPVNGPFLDTGTLRTIVPFIAQPVTHYFLNLQPIGPPGFTGAQPLGDCATLELDTAELLPPEVKPIPSPQLYSDVQPGLAGFNWTTSGGAVKSLLNIYERDENKKCSPTPIDGAPFEVPVSCARSCPASLFPPPVQGLPNPTGYCYDIRDVAANGHVGPASDPQHFEYEVGLFTPSPGVNWSVPFQKGVNAAVLPGDSYDQPVTFSWTTLPDLTSAPAFGFKLGRYPWPETLSAPVPSNCFDQNLTFDICRKDPGPATLYPTTVRGASTTGPVPGAQAGRGRYCWSAWPLFDDPSEPGTPWARQPLAALDLNCYTTGPAKPRIVIPDGEGYSTDPNISPTGIPPLTLSGTIELDYIPANQLKGSVTDGVNSIEFDAVTYCLGDSTFNDVYDCKIPFVFNVGMNTKVTFEVQTFNSDKPTPVMDDASLIHDVKATVTTSSCGTNGQLCCVPDRQGSVLGCDPGERVICDADEIGDGANFRCKTCGGVGETCCNDTLGPPCNPGSHNAFGAVGNSVLECHCDSDQPTCPSPLQAPQGLPISAAMSEVLAACVGQDETLQCAIAGNVFDDPCVIYAPLIGVGISWSPVPGATGYEINQIGGGGIVNSFPLPASDLSTNLLPPSAFAPMAGTIENCGFAGYYVTVSAVDACGDRATSVAAVGMF